MSDAEKHAKTVVMLKTSSWMYMMAAIGFMVAALLRSRNGDSGATYIALGAVFIALGANSARLAKAKSKAGPQSTAKP